MLPNLIIIGAMKCATTSLHYYLGLHPEIKMTTQKELDFFILEKNWGKGLEWYESHFTGGAKISGESSTNYTKYPWFIGVPMRMHSIVPQVKLIYIVRDPLDRIISEYIHHYAEGTENRTISEALTNLKNNYYVDNSKYYMQLEQYLEFYSEPNIFIITTEELNINRRRTLQSIFRFLQVNDSFYCPQYSQKLHTSGEKRRKNRVGSFLTKKFRKSELKNKIRAFLPTFVNRAYISLTRSNTKVEKSVLDDSLRQRLIDELQDDINQLKNYTGNDFEDWCM